LGGVTPLSSLNTSGFDYLPWLSPDELTIYFVSGPSGSGDILRATRASSSTDFDPPQPVSELNSPQDEDGITLSADGLEAILASNRPGGAGKRDLFRSTRASLSEPFANPQPVVELNSSDNEVNPGFSPDGTELYFASTNGGTKSQLYRAARNCSR
jgi:Tol biopolymer transport system component